MRTHLDSSILSSMQMFPVAVTSGNTFVLKPSEKDPGHRLLRFFSLKNDIFDTLKHYIITYKYCKESWLKRYLCCIFLNNYLGSLVFPNLYLQWSVMSALNCLNGRTTLSIITRIVIEITQKYFNYMWRQFVYVDS